jgi:two-component system cell cycle response regulator
MPPQMNLKNLSEKIGKLPTLPGVAMQILEAMRRETPNIKEISEIISSDAPLSAKVLQVVNSPFYGLANKITSVHQAMVYLGLNTVRNLALSFSLLKTFAPKNNRLFDYIQFSKDSLVGALAAKLITEKINQQNGENAFFLGLLQNIGMLIMAESMPEQYKEVVREMKSGGASWDEAENKHIGLNHMEVGKYVAHTWGLPATLTIPIGFHHCPDRLACTLDDTRLLTKILHLSSLYIDLFNTSDRQASYAEIEKCLHAYELYPIINKGVVATEIIEGIRSIFPIFEITIDEKRYIDLIETTRNELAHLSSDLLNQLHSQTQCLNQLTEQVSLDGMTQLYNHKRFLEILRQEISRATRYKTPLSLIMADLDHFKNLLRDTDQVARYGGEEFAIILPMTSLPEAMQAAERLRRSIESREITYQGRSIPVTMSFGIASLENNRQTDVDGLIKMADDALYEAKNTGRNKCCHHKHQNPSKAPSTTVLVIDDEEIVLMTVTKMLERLGYAVIAARSGREVVDLLNQRGDKIDMVIMDMVMPDMSPDQILLAIRNRHSEAKVVLSSGYNPDSVRIKDMFKTTHGFLQKPYQMSELSQIVQATLTN